MTIADPDFLALQRAVAGRFSLERELGRGGMGVVFLARDVQLERPVAIKLLAPALAAREDMRRRFLREARLAAQCFHPHIVPIHEVAEQGPLAWFVMGYVAGETLADRLRRAGPLSTDAVRRLGREIGWALAYAHERGVVHRDVKPENILLEDGTDRALIADFGIAVTSSGPHASGEVAGTARFMAPEQAIGDALDGRADLYALGVTLHLAATGQYPEARTVAGAATAGGGAVTRRRDMLPIALRDVIDRCLALDPAERFSDAPAFVAALETVPQSPELPSAALEVRAAASATRTLVEWTVAMSIAAVCMVAGEEPRSLGRGLMSGTAQAILLFMSGATVARGAEALVLARRAARRRVSDAELTAALAPNDTAAMPRMRPAVSAALIVTGAALAFSQNAVENLGWEWAEFLGAVVTWMLPSILIQRAIDNLLRSIPRDSWFTRAPRRWAAQVARWLGARRTMAAESAPSFAATELRLGHAADEIFARLPHTQQQALRALPAATARLAEDAVALRAEAARISGEQRALRRAPAAAPARAQALEQEREQVARKLESTVAALEAIRLDLLRLESAQTLPGQLTEDLDVVRDLQRHVDAQAEVQRLLRHHSPLAPEPTPV